ncbi:MAG: DUF4954 family protein [Bacteroidetes bacterium]|jgi:hypothetical protein|nr:DUF4954 family protein [Bacteroidota bacterium]MBT4400693.1 DUF4954 family protein [Bacteroidota bacterium]MBT4408715.1 DUF4954 family protein [Bacteroidota bacterium]MBT5427269.1 DUF4954 family protein [Bacteroidota bacterium]MBT7093614.1 DUF4954 family protein [Bacteroidota bacterium]
MSENAYRDLLAEEINVLESQGCQAENWDNVKVKDNFQPASVKNCQFSGEIRLGVFSQPIEFTGGFFRPSGIQNTSFHNCTICDQVYISGVRNYIANYFIDEGVVIENADRIVTSGETSFGNGIPIAVLNETGGREVLMFDRLSAHLAYILALYRHRPKVIKKLNGIIRNFADNKRSKQGYIGPGSTLFNTGIIQNVWIGEASHLESISSLEEGSINSTKEDPIYVGSGVKAKKFIISSGSKVTDSSLIDSCFIGQGVVLAKQYSAENSLFFANCAGYHGEACSIFAGPYTVTHHKSTLLIAAYYSFLNAGSGSNQSNHMYKLGPIHQGIVERGSKTTSDSYILWPSKIGAFTLVMGRHYKNSDTSDLPFSYLIESKDESILAPGVNLRSVGTIRDAQKWPKRDNRKDKDQFDLINFNLLSPFSIQKMGRGRDLLNRLRGSSGRHSDYYFYENCKIPQRALDRGIKLYTLGIDKFLGNTLISRFEKKKVNNVDEIFMKLEPCHRHGAGEWVDLAGLLAPKSLLEHFLDEIETNHFKTIDSIEKEFAVWHADYYEMEWTWAKKMLEDEYGLPISKYESKNVIEIIENWKKAVTDLDKLLFEDAKKEFTLSSQTGFGIDGSESDRNRDFEEVRGDFEKNSSVSAIREHMIKKTKLANKWIEKMGEM